MVNSGVSERTLVVTSKGVKKIIDLVEGDKVLTTDGYRKVIELVRTGRPRTVKEYVFTTPIGYYHLTTTKQMAVGSSEKSISILDLRGTDVLFVLDYMGKIHRTNMTTEWGIKRPDEDMYNIILEDGMDYFANGLLINSYDNGE